MMKNDVASFFYYMWNCWNEEECKIVFAEDFPPHFWNKWREYSGMYSSYGAVEAFFASLSDHYQDKLVEHSVKMYDRKRRKL